jgi:lipid II:glycine glycyltransferase (peptidoglycan interpeptide bridge formation enzyme)
MKQKTRYNIRLAEKKEVVIRESDDIDAFYALMQTTGERDQFGVHSREYYQRAYDLFAPAGNCTLLLAEYHHQPLAGLMVFAHGRRAWYFYGASSNQERHRMPAYLLQFQAMRWAAARGCEIYDLWGIPDFDEEVLEREFSNREDGLWGVYRFKRGFGGEIRRSIGAWDKVYQPLLYRLYQFYTRGRSND